MSKPTKPDILPVNSAYLDVNRFNKWMSRLENLIQKLESQDSNNDNKLNDTELVNNVLETLSDCEKYPKWIRDINNEKIKELISSSERFRFLLRHISLPQSFNDFYDLIREESSIVLSNDYLSIKPTKESLNNFMKTLDKSNNTDGITRLCQYTDNKYRVLKSKSKDITLIKNRKRKNINKLNLWSKHNSFNKQRLQLINIDNPKSDLSLYINNLQTQLDENANLLKNAEIEEEKLKRMYNAAVYKRKQLDSKVNEISNILNQSTTQQKILCDTINKSLEIEEYNINLITKQLKIYDQLETLMKIFNKYITNDKFTNEILSILASFKSQINSSLDSRVFDIYLRISLEMVCLWRKYNIYNIDKDFENVIKDYEDDIKCLLRNDESPQVELPQDCRNINNYTVILYYDHIVHDTPSNHVENQARVKSCLHKLFDQLTVNCNSNDLRDLQFVKCNDIVSPPLWCLPLVHAPKYLHQLKSLELEADRDDLVVPIEFDSEWESDIDSDDEYLNELNNTNNSILYKNSLLLDKVNMVVSNGTNYNKETINELSNALTPKTLDYLLYNDVDSKSIIKTKNPHIDQDLDNSHPKSTIVITKYGKGMLLSTGISSNHIYKVKLPWAIGYFHISSIQIVRDTKIPSFPISDFRSFLYSSTFHISSDNVLLLTFVRKLINKVGILDVTTALDVHKSWVILWTHGKASISISKEIETAIIEWIYEMFAEDIRYSSSLETVPPIINLVAIYKIENYKSKESNKEPNVATESNDNKKQKNDDSLIPLEEKILRDIIRRLMENLKISQVKLAKDLEGLGVINSTTHRLSSWIRCKISVPSSMNDQYVKAGWEWLEEKREYLTEAEANIVDSYQYWIRNDKLTANYGMLLDFIGRYQTSTRLNNPIKSSKVEIQIAPSTENPTTEIKSSHNTTNKTAKQVTLKPVEYSLKTIGDLLNAVNGEITRRKLTAAVVLKEASKDTEEDLISLNNFIDTGTVKNTDQGRDLCRKLVKWIAKSCLEPSYKCRNCGKLRDSFSTSKTFLIHESFCGVNNSITNDKISSSVDDSMSNTSDYNPENSNSTGVKQENNDNAMEVDSESDKNNRNSSEVHDLTMDNGESVKQAPNSPDITYKKVNQSKENGRPNKRLKRSKESEIISDNDENDLSNNDTNLDDDNDSLKESKRKSKSTMELPKYTSDNIIKGENPPSKHRNSCEICLKKKYENISFKCLYCPAIYCNECFEKDKSNKTSSCINCIEVNFEDCGFLSSAQIHDEKYLVNRWVLIYISATTHRWRVAYVCARSPDTKTGIYLVKWVRNDNKGGKLQWVDISRCRVYLSKSELNNEKLFMEQIKQAQSMVKKLKNKDHNTDSNDDNDNNSSDNDIDSVASALDMSDSYIGKQSLQAALCTAGIACRAVDIVMENINTNVFACTRPPGHHAGRYGCTKSCVSTGFCLLNNAAIALTYARVVWGLNRVAVVDFDVHYGNGTADILKNDPNAFFASLHMVYGINNDESVDKSQDCCGFYPSHLGKTEISDKFICIAIQPNKLTGKHKKKLNETISNKSDDLYYGFKGYRKALDNIVIPKLIQFNPELLIISAGFDGFTSDPIGGGMKLTIEDYEWTTKQLLDAMESIQGKSNAKVISLLEGGYDTSSQSLGLAHCVDAHVAELRKLNN